jgi:hypothetical protein
MPDLESIIATFVALAGLAMFAVMIWAGHHQS